MAIKKTKTLPSGVTGEYWKIVKETHNRVSDEMTWEIALFLDQAASNAGKKQLNLSKIFKAIVTEEEASGNRTALGYTKIKQQASSMVSPHSGSLNLEPTPFDIDLYNGEDV